jgi:hypothetical protein
LNHKGLAAAWDFINVLDLGKFVITQSWKIEDNLTSVSGANCEKIALRPNTCAQRSHYFFADGI